MLRLPLALLLALSSTAQAQTTDFSDVVRKVAPSVVNITTEGTSLEGIFPLPMPEDMPGVQGQGAGFLVAANGTIVTNNHVVEGAQSIQVEMQDGKTYDATLIGTDPLTDIAVLDIEGDDHPVLTFADSDQVEVGDWALALGNPLGQGFSVSLGIVSARGRMLSGAFDDYLQTDAAINRGNSGGPLFNDRGEVIGMNTAILSPTGGSIGIGFAMSSNVVEDVTTQIITYGTTRRGWLGVQMQEVTPGIAEAVGLDEPKGALVVELVEGPASEAGILSGDIVVGFDGSPIADTADLTRRIAKAGPDATVELDVWREGNRQSITVALGSREETQTAMQAKANEPATFEGWTFANLEDTDKSRLNLPATVDGVRITETPDTGVLAIDDVVVSINQQPIARAQDAVQALQALKNAGRTSALLQVARGGKPMFVVFPLNR